MVLVQSDVCLLSFWRERLFAPTYITRSGEALRRVAARTDAAGSWWKLPAVIITNSPGLLQSRCDGTLSR